MRIRPEHIERELERDLLPVYLVSGDEPLLVQEVCDAIRNKCKEHGHDERSILSVDRQFDWQRLNDEGSSLSLFAQKKLTELRLGTAKPGTPGAKALKEYCSRPPEDTILLIECGKLDASTMKSKWMNEIDNLGGIVQVWPIALHEMPAWLSNRARKLKLDITQDAISLLSDRLEGNLLAAQQELEKLKLLFNTETIDTDQVLESVSDSSKYDIFNLTDACLNANQSLCIKIISNLRAEGFEPNIALWALSKEIRLLAHLTMAEQNGQPHAVIFKQHRVINKRQAALSKAARSLSRQSIADMLALCKQADDLVKGVDKGRSVWDVILSITLQLAGQRAI